MEDDEEEREPIEAILSEEEDLLHFPSFLDDEPPPSKPPLK